MLDKKGTTRLLRIASIIVSQLGTSVNPYEANSSRSPLRVLGIDALTAVTSV